MNTAGKLAAFATAVAVAFGGAMVVGAAVGPIDVGDDTAHDAAGDTTLVLPRGLAVAQDGYRFAPDTSTIEAGAQTTFAFRILDDRGAPVTGFDVLHERPLHLIVLSRDMTDYAHLHPTLDEHGKWTVDLPSLTPGSYRVFADFQPTGADNLTLATDLLVPGAVGASALPAPSTVSEVDGYTVTLTGTPQTGDSDLSFDVEHAGHAIATDPYLGAAGHLVAIRSGDLGYLHVHPRDNDTSDTVTFTAEFPSAGTYRLFFDYSHNGTVRTASFTLEVPGTGSTTNPTPTDPHEQGH